LDRDTLILQDIGWYKIDETDIFSKGFDKNWKQSNVCFLHEREGSRMAQELLGRHTLEFGYLRSQYSMSNASCCGKAIYWSIASEPRITSSAEL
jgi:hypothetical protein